MEVHFVSSIWHLTMVRLPCDLSLAESASKAFLSGPSASSVETWPLTSANWHPMRRMPKYVTIAMGFHPFRKRPLDNLFSFLPCSSGSFSVVFSGLFTLRAPDVLDLVLEVCELGLLLYDAAIQAADGLVLLIDDSIISSHLLLPGMSSLKLGELVKYLSHAFTTETVGSCC